MHWTTFHKLLGASVLLFGAGRDGISWNIDTRWCLFMASRALHMLPGGSFTFSASSSASIAKKKKKKKIESVRPERRHGHSHLHKTRRPITSCAFDAVRPCQTRRRVLSLGAKNLMESKQ